MFTGIIDNVGTVKKAASVDGGRQFRIDAAASAKELFVNDSVAINGVCQTVVWRNDVSFEVLAVEETLKKTTFSALDINERVNLELPVRLNERLGGHLVLGHVDTVGHVVKIDRQPSSTLFTVEVEPQYAKYLVPVGSIAVDGVSLTVAETTGNQLKVSIIPHTMDHTIFGLYRAGTRVNLEFDIIGKYVERLLKGDQVGAVPKNFPTEKDLRQEGF